MNPLNLLTKGHTILGLREPHGAYKLSEDSLLPDFSKSKHPVFKTQPAPEETQPALFEQPHPKVEEVEAPAPVLAAPTPPVPAKAAKDEPLKPGPWSRLARVVADLARKWMPRRKAAQSVTVQAELALEKVKVLRNDLSEDDLEVVIIDKEAGKKTEEPARNGKTELEKLTVNP